MNNSTVFRKDDVVIDPSCYYPNKKWVVSKLTGNDYCPELFVFAKGLPRTTRNCCNLDRRTAQLIDATKRPFRKIPMKTLLKLRLSGNVEAEREFEMRINKNA